MRSLSLVVLICASLSAGACEKKDEATPKPTAETPTQPAAEAPTQAPSVDPGSIAEIMAGIADEMTTAQLGLWTENYELIASSAMRIADHPKLSESEKARVMKVLGEDMQAFAGMDKAVHDQAVKLAEVAAKKDVHATLEGLSALQAGCVSCHSVFRDRLITK